MLTLAIDTSAKSASIAVLRDSDILSEILVNLDVNHSAVLLPALDDLLKLSRIETGRDRPLCVHYGTRFIYGAARGREYRKRTRPRHGQADCRRIDTGGPGVQYHMPGHPSLSHARRKERPGIYGPLQDRVPEYTLEIIETERVTDIREFLR